MRGGSEFALSCPLTCATPFSVAGDPCAVTVIVRLATARGTHVADHAPFCVDVSASGGSPLENAATTVPFAKFWPQSSVTCTSMGAGQPAESVNPDPKPVSVGISFAGVQPDAWPLKRPAPVTCAGAATISVSGTVRTLPSEKVSVSVAV